MQRKQFCKTTQRAQTKRKQRESAEETVWSVAKRIKIQPCSCQKVTKTWTTLASASSELRQSRCKWSYTKYTHQTALYTTDTEHSETSNALNYPCPNLFSPSTLAVALKASSNSQSGGFCLTADTTYVCVYCVCIYLSAICCWFFTAAANPRVMSLIGSSFICWHCKLLSR